MRLSLLVLLSVPLLLQAQWQTGWRSDTYAGINATFTNPANPGRTPYAWDINLGEASFFGANNYAYLQNTSVGRLLRDRNNNTTFLFARDVPADLEKQDGLYVYDFLENSSYYAHIHASLMGPSASVRIAPQTRIGIFTRTQMRLDAVGIDSDLGFYQWESIANEQPFTVDETHIATAAWSEVGLNLSQGITTASGTLIIGATARRLWGHRAGYLASKKPFTLSKLPAAVGLEGLDFDIEGGFTNNAISDSIYVDSPGRGFAFDLGFLYQIDLGDGFYRWELGASLIDAGNIRFLDAERHAFNNANFAQVLNDNYENLTVEDGVEEVVTQFSNDVLGNAQASLIEETFTMRLPATIGLQAAYRFNEWVKVEANLLVGLPSTQAGMQRATLLAITPRLERHWWGLSVPVSLYAGKQLRMGLAARLGPLFIGTDHLGSFFNDKQFTGTDVYMGVKLHPWGLSNGKSSRTTTFKSGKKRGKTVECYKF
ncbi:MAG: DUF5723 family protein [Saprospiraceae bacterium]